MSCEKQLNFTYFEKRYLCFTLASSANTVLTTAKMSAGQYLWRCFSSFVPNALFLYSLKTSENQKFFWCFQGYRKGALRTNGLIFSTKILLVLELFCMSKEVNSKREVISQYWTKNLHILLLFSVVPLHQEWNGLLSTWSECTSYLTICWKT